ncbi:hypothetical protein [Qipengyuania sp. JC766]|uniref:hypothetical protein n=1 Tax=Qipengyuania sp. JC766 TaxID=3232139 RepID=UPI003458054E
MSSENEDIARLRAELLQFVLDEFRLAATDGEAAPALARFREAFAEDVRSIVRETLRAEMPHYRTVSLSDEDVGRVAAALGALHYSDEPERGRPAAASETPIEDAPRASRRSGIIGNAQERRDERTSSTELWLKGLAALLLTVAAGAMVYYFLIQPQDEPDVVRTAEPIETATPGLDKGGPDQPTSEPNEVPAPAPTSTSQAN